MPQSVSVGARAMARAEIMRQVVATGRRHLAAEGAAALSLRAVARDLGMVSSAVYRYVASRDDLLTLLIIDAYDAIGEAVERAEAKIDRADRRGRWLAACLAARRWAQRHPHEYALIYGSPVPGYAAPADTVDPAARVARVLLGIVVEEVQAGGGPPGGAGASLPVAVVRAIGPMRQELPAALDDAGVVSAVIAWTHLFGAISFELFGHRVGVLAEGAPARDAFFVEEMGRQADEFALSGPGGG